MEFVYEMPPNMLKAPETCGRVERFEYDTFTYDEGGSRPLHKGAWVYLPPEYSEEKQYDILYLLHGGGVNEDWWLKTFPDTVTILNNMMTEGICKPCIIVTPTYYRQDEVDQDAEYVTENFWMELRKDLIPKVESRYAGYSRGDVSEDNLIRTRDHRAAAGLSLGSMTTYRAAFYHNFDLFAWYGPFSGCAGPQGVLPREVDRIRETLEEGEKKGLELRYMLCCNGDQDIAYRDQTDIMAAALKAAPQLQPKVNYDYFVIPGGVHDMKAWQLHLYHALQVFFR